VKVQRPHMPEIVDADLTSLRYIVRWLDRHTPIGKRANLPLILREFEETLTLELDYQAEGHHAERLATMFAGNSQIAIPRIYWSHSADRMLSLQFMRGIKITDFGAMEIAGIDRRETAEILMRAYLKQVVEVGFFHADPHPGNILVRPGPVIVLLDFGMVGDISPAMRDNLRRVFLGVVRRDFDEILVALTKLGFIPTNADRHVLRQALAWTIDTFYEMSFAELQAVDPQLVLDRLQEVFYTQSVQIPAYFAFLGRALGTLSGLCTSLDPSFQFVTVAEPFARRLIAPSPAAVVRQAIQEVRTVIGSVYALPRLSQAVLDRVEDGSYEVKQPIEEAVQSVRRLERSVSRVLYAVLSSAFLVTAVLTLRTHLGFLALVPLAVAAVLLINILLSARRSRVRR
jgi:predicted unusual protein kinase regulating ubiquinone biosynthesis (AarF/ABC1/UbiB family)